MCNAVKHMDPSPCSWPTGCPTHALWRIGHGSGDLLIGVVCARCGLLDREYPWKPVFESWEPLQVLEWNSTINLRYLIERHPANFRAWSVYVPQQLAATSIYR